MQRKTMLHAAVVTALSVSALNAGAAAATAGPGVSSSSPSSTTTTSTGPAAPSVTSTTTAPPSSTVSTSSAPSGTSMTSAPSAPSVSTSSSSSSSAVPGAGVSPAGGSQSGVVPSTGTSSSSRGEDSSRGPGAGAAASPTSPSTGGGAAAATPGPVPGGAAVPPGSESREPSGSPSTGRDPTGTTSQPSGSPAASAPKPGNPGSSGAGAKPGSNSSAEKPSGDDPSAASGQNGKDKEKDKENPKSEKENGKADKDPGKADGAGKDDGKQPAQPSGKPTPASAPVQVSSDAHFEAVNGWWSNAVPAYEDKYFNGVDVLKGIGSQEGDRHLEGIRVFTTDPKQVGAEGATPVEGKDVTVVINADQLEERNRSAIYSGMRYVHDANVNDKRTVRKTTTWVLSTENAQKVGSKTQPFYVDLQSAAAAAGTFKSGQAPKNVHEFHFDGEKTKAYAHIRNVDSTVWEDGKKSEKIVASPLNNETSVFVSNGAEWSGDLITLENYWNEGTKAVRTRATKDDSVNNTVNKLAVDAKSSWIGKTSNLGRGARRTDILLDGTWTANADSDFSTLTGDGTVNVGGVKLSVGEKLDLAKIVGTAKEKEAATGTIALADKALLRVRKEANIGLVTTGGTSTIGIADGAHVSIGQLGEAYKAAAAKPPVAEQPGGGAKPPAAAAAGASGGPDATPGASMNKPAGSEGSGGRRRSRRAVENVQPSGAASGAQPSAVSNGPAAAQPAANGQPAASGQPAAQPNDKPEVQGHPELNKPAPQPAASAPVKPKATPKEVFDIRFEGLSANTGLSVRDRLADTTDVRLVAASDLNKKEGGAAEVAAEMYNLVTLNSEDKARAFDFTVEASQYGDGYEGTVSAGNGAGAAPVISKLRVLQNKNALAVVDATGLTYLQWRAEADDAQERLGDLRNQPGEGGVWGRITGGNVKVNGIDADVKSVMFGSDRKVDLAGAPVWVGGALSYTDGNADLMGQAGKGRSDMSTVAGTLYGQWVSDDGTFVDVSAKLGRINTEFKLPGIRGDLHNTAASVALEAGHRFDFGKVGTGFWVEPGMGYTYARIFGGDYDSGNVKVKQSGLDSSVLRAGLKAGVSDAKLGGIYARVDYLYEFDGEATTTFGQQNRVTKDFGGGWYEVGFGGNVNFAQNVRGWAEVKRASGGDLTMPWRASVGVRWMY